MNVVFICVLLISSTKFLKSYGQFTPTTSSKNASDVEPNTAANSINNKEILYNETSRRSDNFNPITISDVVENKMNAEENEIQTPQNVSDEIEKLHKNIGIINNIVSHSFNDLKTLSKVSENNDSSLTLKSPRTTNLTDHLLNFLRLYPQIDKFSDSFSSGTSSVYYIENAGRKRRNIRSLDTFRNVNNFSIFHKRKKKSGMNVNETSVDSITITPSTENSKVLMQETEIEKQETHHREESGNVPANAIETTEKLDTGIIGALEKNIENALDRKSSKNAFETAKSINMQDFSARNGSDVDNFDKFLSSGIFKDNDFKNFIKNISSEVLYNFNKVYSSSLTTESTIDNASSVEYSFVNLHPFKSGFLIAVDIILTLVFLFAILYCFAICVMVPNRSTEQKSKGGSKISLLPKCDKETKVKPKSSIKQFPTRKQSSRESFTRKLTPRTLISWASSRSFASQRNLPKKQQVEDLKHDEVQELPNDLVSNIKASTVSEVVSCGGINGEEKEQLLKNLSPPVLQNVFHSASIKDTIITIDPQKEDEYLKHEKSLEIPNMKRQGKLYTGGDKEQNGPQPCTLVSQNAFPMSSVRISLKNFNNRQVNVSGDFATAPDVHTASLFSDKPDTKQSDELTKVIRSYSEDDLQTILKEDFDVESLKNHILTSDHKMDNLLLTNKWKRGIFADNNMPLAHGRPSYTMLDYEPTYRDKIDFDRIKDAASYGVLSKDRKLQNEYWNR